MKAQQGLDNLSKEFPPEDVKFTVAFSDTNLDDLAVSAEKMVRRLKEFSDSNFDEQTGKRLGLRVDYKS